MAQTIKVLMVDDDKMLLDMYSERLELAGFKVDTSSNGEECLAKIHQVKPDIVLLDIMMPKVNGYETLAAIKSDPETKDIPVIILSALVRDINKGRAIEAGADDYIIKSEVMPADVIGKIQSVLQKYHKDVVLPKNDTPPPAAPAAPTPPVTPPPPPAPPKEDPPAESSDIQFEPAAPVSAPAPVVPTPPIPAKPAQGKIYSTPSGVNTKITKKNSPVVLFFLVLITLLIIASDIFFYLRLS